MRILLLIALWATFAGCDRRPKPQEEVRAQPLRKQDVVSFWLWFSDSAIRLRGREPEEAAAALNARLEAQGFEVYAELDPAEPNWRLIITADGIRERMPEVEKLVATARETPGWTVVAYRQPTGVAGMTMEMDGQKLAYDDVRVTATPAGDMIDLRVYLPGCRTDRETAVHMGFLALDHTIGEETMLKRIGVIDWFDVAEAPADARPLAELPTMLDRWPTRD
jgi:hypothetical protein